MSNHSSGPIHWGKLHVGVSICAPASLRREERLDKVYLHAGEKSRSWLVPYSF
jgi:hypothetical protein